MPPSVTLLDAGASEADAQVSGNMIDLASSVSFAIVTDYLVIYDEKLKAAKPKCSVTNIAFHRAIPLRNVLWAELTADEINIHYAEFKSSKRSSRKNPKVSSLTYKADVTPQLEFWINNLLSRAYGDAQQRKRAYVLVNPHAGPGGANKIWRKYVQPIFKAARMRVTMVETQAARDAIKLVKSLDVDDLDAIVACSGDGLPYEIFNGLAQRPDARHALSKVAVCQIPCGSGNAMCCNLTGVRSPGAAALAIVKGVSTPLDLVSITQGDTRTVSFLSQALGMIAELDLNTEHLRWMGSQRFTAGFLAQLLKRKTYPCDIAYLCKVEDKDDVKSHYSRSVKAARNPTCGSLRSGSSATMNEGLASASHSTTSFPAPSASLLSPSHAGLPPLRYGTVNDPLPPDWKVMRLDELGNFYCGNMAYMAPDANFFPAAFPHDGLLDLVTVNASISPLKLIQIQLAVERGLHFDHPLISYKKVAAYRLTPRSLDKDGLISIDGERMPFQPFQAEVHPGLGRVLSLKGYYEADGPPNWEAPMTPTADTAPAVGAVVGCPATGASIDCPAEVSGRECPAAAQSQASLRPKMGRSRC